MVEPIKDIKNGRKSACSDAAQRAQLQQINRMTIEERVKAALSMRERFTWLKPISKGK